MGGAAQGWENSSALAQPPLGKQCPGELRASPGRWEARQPLQKSKQEISQRLQALGTSLGEQTGREHRSNLQTRGHCRTVEAGKKIWEWDVSPPQASPFPTEGGQLA